MGSDDGTDWRLGVEGEVAAYVLDSNERTLRSYDAKPELVLEHANIERSTTQGGYGHRQLYELIQNGADAIAESGGTGRIAVLLTEDALYCANEGRPLDADGIAAILSSHVSRKRGAEIGRFGLGFKSVLGVTSRPLFLSRWGSFQFDQEWSQREIARVVPHADRYPVLRLAQPADAFAERERDPIVDQLMDWATTIVKLPLLAGTGSWLHGDLDRFPAEFLLFSPHVRELDLLASGWGNERRLRLHRREGHVLELEDGEDRSTWRVFDTVHHPSPEARADAGELADRGELPIAWAVPMERRRDRGQFWAFFPTEYQMTLDGILNAPWKTNEDRQNLLNSAFNRELLSAAANLVSRSLTSLVQPEDPGRHLELLPARATMQWADEHLSEEIDGSVQEMPILPDQDGVLRRPPELGLCPQGLPTSALDLWAAASDRPANWCHHSVVGRLRWAKAERLVSRAATVTEWVGELVRATIPSSSVAALRVMGAIHSDGNPDKRTISELQSLPVVLTTADTLVQVTNDRLFLAVDGHDDAVAGMHVVHPDVAADFDARQVLLHSGVRRAERSNPLPQFVAQIAGGGRFDDWDAFWAAVRVADDQSLAELRSIRARLRVRTRAGAWVGLDDGLLPGAVLGQSPADDDVAIDADHHRAELAALKRLGVSDRPTAGRSDVRGESWYGDYRAHALRRFLSQARERTRQSPRENLIGFDKKRAAGPIGLLDRLQPAHRPRYTELLLKAQDELTWTMRHRSQDTYGRLEWPNPVDWLLRDRGWVQTTGGPARVATAHPSFALPLGAKLPVSMAAEAVAIRLGIPGRPEELSAGQLADLLSAMEHVDDPRSLMSLGEVYALVADHHPPPDRIRCLEGGRLLSGPTTDVSVTSDPTLVSLVAKRTGVLLAPSEEAAQVLAVRWGLRHLGDTEGARVFFEADGDPFFLADQYPDLAALAGERADDVEVQPCIRLHVGLTVDGKDVAEARLAHLQDRTAYVDQTEGEEPALRALMAVLGVEVSDERVERAVQGRAQAEVEALRGAIADEPDLGRKLELAVRVDVLRQSLPPSLPAPRDGVGALALAVFGVDVLRTFRDVLADRGLAPPRSWAGSAAARRFVDGLGFPVEYAGFAPADLAASFEVLGRPDLPPLHEFQEQISDEVRGVLRGKDGFRGLVSLPTGAGKTRVAVESWIREHASGWEGPVIWIAQTEELCEQAVQTWSYAWRALGPDAPLTVSRLWSNRQAAPVEGNHVVVATIQKMSLMAERDNVQYRWLRDCAGLFVDEAHGSITASYTRLMRWLGFGYGASREQDTVPFVGLTATPFRGFNDEESDRLAARYDRRLLNRVAFRDGDDHARLQSMGVLARVRHELLQGSKLKLQRSEMEELERFHRLPRHVEDRLGRDSARNDRIVNAIRELPEDWTVLVFATSVDHAKILAGLLTLSDVPAAPIWGETPVGARRHYIREFRAGRLRVLTNYNVLAEGFDAPAVRAVFVARPTWSPNRYQQMVGRGLRGPLNGGKEECLIVDVGDNVDRFGRQLAFRHFDHLWNVQHQHAGTTSAAGRPDAG